MRHKKVLIIGGGIAGLAAAYELQKSGFVPQILEASHRVGGRIRTARDAFASGLHGELGAMRIPSSHKLVHKYLERFDMTKDLESFEQRNKLIYLSGLGEVLSYSEFEDRLRKKSKRLLKLFAGLRRNEQGKTIDELWVEAMKPLSDHASKCKQNYIGGAPYNPQLQALSKEDLLEAAEIHSRHELLRKFDQHTLQSYLEQVAGWSPDCVRLYDSCSAHVVLGNAIGESVADSFLSSETEGATQSMQQISGGLDRFAWAFLNHQPNPLSERIIFGARVRKVRHSARGADSIEIYYERAGQQRKIAGDYVVFAVPFPAMKTIKMEPNFSPEKRDAIANLRYVEVTKILAQFKSRWWEKYLDDRKLGKEGGLITDLPIRYLMFPNSESSQFDSPQQRRGVVMASYTFERDAAGLGPLNETDKLNVVRENLGEIFGDEIIDDSLEVSTSHNWSNDSLAGGAAFAYFGPHQQSRLYPNMILPDWDGRAYFAGEHMSTLHGWMEGALASAQRVAMEICEHTLA